METITSDTKKDALLTSALDINSNALFASTLRSNINLLGDKVLGDKKESEDFLVLCAQMIVSVNEQLNKDYPRGFGHKETKLLEIIKRNLVHMYHCEIENTLSRAEAKTSDMNSFFYGECKEEADEDIAPAI